MKMTPEQKAFFEYGLFFEMVCRRAELLRTARKRCAENPERYGPGLPMARMLFERTVNKARQKRTACRAFIGSNSCSSRACNSLSQRIECTLLHGTRRRGYEMNYNPQLTLF